MMMARKRNQQERPLSRDACNIQPDTFEEDVDAVVAELTDIDIPKEVMAKLCREIINRSHNAVFDMGPPYKMKIYESAESDEPTMIIAYPHGVMWRIHKVKRLPEDDQDRQDGHAHYVESTSHAQIMIPTEGDDVFGDQLIVAEHIRRAQKAYDKDDKTLKPQRDKVQAEAKKKWQPWRQRYRRLLDDGVKPSKAIADVGNAMTEQGVVNPKTGQPYSEPTLWKQLRRPT